MEREYFDAKFEGLEKSTTAELKGLKDLVMYYQQTTTNYIGSVNSGVKEVRKDLTKVTDELRHHKESIDPHGRRATDKYSQSIVSWLGLAVASILAIVEIGRHM